jgi:hypothetical protein
MMSSIILRRHLPQLLNDEQYNIKTASAATAQMMRSIMQTVSSPLVEEMKFWAAT